MISKNKIKYINSLKLKKNRQKEKTFVCEGFKIFDLLVNSNFKIKEVFATADFIEQKTDKYANIKFQKINVKELSKISSLKTPQKILATVQIPEEKKIIDIEKKLTLVLDKIQDPGNLGTIIRIADWFGIENIICSANSVDVYNSKVIQATMGSIFRVNIHYKNITDFLLNIKNKNIPVYGTFINGQNIYSTNLSSAGIIIMGNESNGITPEIEKHITTKISIPSYNNTKIAESLNVAVATSVICAEFKRKF